MVFPEIETGVSFSNNVLHAPDRRQDFIFDVRPMVLVALGVVIVFSLITRYLPFGRRLYAIGSNPEAARMGGLPLGLSHDVRLVRPVAAGQSLTWDDVAIDTSTDAYRTRREMESMFAPGR